MTEASDMTAAQVMDSQLEAGSPGNDGGTVVLQAPSGPTVRQQRDDERARKQAEQTERARSAFSKLTGGSSVKDARRESAEEAPTRRQNERVATPASERQALPTRAGATKNTEAAPAAPAKTETAPKAADTSPSDELERATRACRKVGIPFSALKAMSKDDLIATAKSVGVFVSSSDEVRRQLAEAKRQSAPQSGGHSNEPAPKPGTKEAMPKAGQQADGDLGGVVATLIEALALDGTQHAPTLTKFAETIRSPLVAENAALKAQLERAEEHGSERDETLNEVLFESARARLGERFAQLNGQDEDVIDDIADRMNLLLTAHKLSPSDRYTDVSKPELFRRLMEDACRNAGLTETTEAARDRQRRDEIKRVASRVTAPTTRSVPPSAMTGEQRAGAAWNALLGGGNPRQIRRELNASV